MYNRLLFTVVAMSSGVDAGMQEVGQKVDNSIMAASNAATSAKNGVVNAVTGVTSTVTGSFSALAQGTYNIGAHLRYKDAIEILPLTALKPKDMLVRLNQRRLDIAYFLEFSNQDKSASKDDLNIKIAEAELQSVEEMIAMINGAAEEERKTLNGPKGAEKALTFFQWRRSKGWKNAFDFASNTATGAANAASNAVASSSKYVNTKATSIIESTQKRLKDTKRYALRSIVDHGRDILDKLEPVDE